MAESSDKYGEAAEAAFEKWWQSWRAANGYPNTERMRDAARAVYESLAYSSTDSAFETLFKQGHIEPERIPSAAALSDEQLSQAVKFRDASPNMSDSFAIAAAAPRSHAGDSRLREELLRLRQWFEDRPDRPGHKAQVIYINGVLEIADSARSATPSTDDARDAARYRYLRAHWDDFTGYASKNPGEWLDKTLDAALVKDGSPEHVCGLQGYNPMIDPPCPGCEWRNRSESTARKDG